MKRVLRTVLALTTAALAGCSTTDIVSNLASATGLVSSSQAESVLKAGSAVKKASEGTTPEQEYYIGRSVIATLLATYKPYDNKTANQYINRIGQAVAQASDKPVTFAGYHFLVVDSDEINAFAAPGGFILVSRGLLRCCPTEDALAAVLAHEVAHVQCAHGLKAIQSSRWSGALTTVGVEVGKQYAPAELATLVGAFEEGINDMVTTMAAKGYSKTSEYEADRTAVEILRRVGYQPQALHEMLMEMDRRLGDTKLGFGQTHPKASDRAARVKALLQEAGPVQPVANRQQRLARALKDV